MGKGTSLAASEQVPWEVGRWHLVPITWILQYVFTMGILENIFCVLKLIFFLLTGRSLHQLLSLLSAERGSQLPPSCRSLGEELHSWWFCTYKTAVLKVRSLTLRPRAGSVHVTDRQLSLPATRCEKPEGPMCDAG